MNKISKDEISKEQDVEFEDEHAFNANESTSLILFEPEQKTKRKCFEKNWKTKFVIGGIIL